MQIRKNASILAVCGPTDMRKQIKGMVEIVKEYGTSRIRDMNYYVFCNKNLNTIKILYYEENGYHLLAKKFDKQYYFYWPMSNSQLVKITKTQLEYLLKGVDIWATIKVPSDKTQKMNTKGYNKVMMWPFPDKEYLNRIISERNNNFNQQIITGFIQEGTETFYIDKKGLVHKSGPRGEIVSFVGWTNEQMESMKNSEKIAPIPR
jgi:transposase